MTAFEKFATDAISQSAQEYIRQTIQNDLDRINYDISSAMDDMFAMMMHVYHNEPELFEKNMQVFHEVEDKIFNFRERLAEATSMTEIKTKLRQRRGLLANLVGGAL